MLTRTVAESPRRGHDGAGRKHDPAEEIVVGRSAAEHDDPLFRRDPA